MDLHIPTAVIAVAVALMPVAGAYIGSVIDPPSHGHLPLPSFLGAALFLLLAGLCWGGLAVWMVMR